MRSNYSGGKMTRAIEAVGQLSSLWWLAMLYCNMRIVIGIDKKMKKRVTKLYPLRFTFNACIWSAGSRQSTQLFRIWIFMKLGFNHLFLENNRDSVFIYFITFNTPYYIFGYLYLLSSFINRTWRLSSNSMRWYFHIFI